MIMMLLAALLLAVAIFLIVVAAVEGGDSVAVEVFSRDLDVTIFGIFLTGVAATLAALVGLALLRVGAQRTRAHRKEIAYLRQKVSEQERAERSGGPDETPVGEQAGESSGETHARSDRPADLP